MRLSKFVSLVFLIIALAAFSAHAALLGPSAYITSADSPFFPFGGFTYFHLENFDDHLLNTPGVSVTAGTFSAANSGFSGSIIDQVGLNGGCPAGGLSVACDTWFGSGQTGLTFTFNAGALGQLPNAAGLVWTDGAGTITFEAFDQNGNSLGTLTGNHADGSFFGTIADDRFYGATNSGGISKIFISNSSGGIEVDDLQYGCRDCGGPVATPEPSTLLLMLSGLAGFGAMKRKLRQ